MNDLHNSINSKSRRKIVFILILLLVILLTLCITSQFSSKKYDIEPSINKITPLPTRTHTPTPTPYFIQLPYILKSTEGWIYRIIDVDIVTTIGKRAAENTYFLIVVMEIENQTAKFDCLMMDEFFASDGIQEIPMKLLNLRAADRQYITNYPGMFFGQCLSERESEKSILVFDIPSSNLEWSIDLQDKKVKIGKISTILNPPPTITPTNTLVPTITLTPTLTTTHTTTNTPIPEGIIEPPIGRIIFTFYGPGENYPTAFKIHGHTTFTLMARNNDNTWLLIDTIVGGKGWIERGDANVSYNPLIIRVSNEILPTHTSTPTITITPTNTQTTRPSITPYPAISLRDFYRYYDDHTYLLFNRYLGEVLGKPVREPVKVENVDEYGRLLLAEFRNLWEDNTFNMCVVVDGIPNRVAYQITRGSTINLEAYILSFDDNMSYIQKFTCYTTITLYYRDIH